MRILISGACGFIGSHLCRCFIERGDEVIGVDNLLTSSLDNLEGVRNDKNFLFIEHDISKELFLEGKIDWVMHFASPASPPDYSKYPIKTLKVGTLGTLNCLGIAKAKGAKFFLASTSEIYGDPKVYPQKEEYWGNVNPIGLRSCYDESKRLAEALTFAYHRQHKIEIRVIRIFNTYGPFMRPNDGRVVSNFINQALRGESLTVYGQGEQTRSFCYVDDLIEGILKLMEVNYQLPLNLGNPDEYKIIDLARKIIEMTKSKSEIQYFPLPQDDPKRRCPDITKAKQILSWQPKVSLTEGIKKTIEYFKSIKKKPKEEK